ncbi:MAG TPA: NAD(P)H-binding protein [Solirubrobacteraceae bacterium]|nr:NAD(P)H-binding protein [Solirubrobacteraceae bacterium]
MLLLTGATGRVGSALLRRLIARREPVRCLVRDPRRLGPERVRVQIALGDLGVPASFRHALRGVRTVVHLAATERDQPHATIEEVDGVAVWRLLRAAERAGVEHFVFVSPLGATPYHRARLHRAKALAEEAVAGAALRTTTLRCSLIYSPGDRRLALLDLLASLLPVVPVTGTMARARSQPIWSEDVAACVAAALDRSGDQQHEHFELAGPEAVSHREAVEVALRAAGRPRRLLALPSGVILRGLAAYEALTGPVAIATRDEADLLAATMLTARGTADAEALGVTPHRMADVLAGAA